MGPDVDDTDWRSYIRHLPTKEDFKMLVADMKETTKSEIATM